MTPDERNLLGHFLQDLTQARGGLKDAEAADMIDRSLHGNPDAAYLLVQHAIIADQALHAAQDRIGQLETEARDAPAPQGSGSFLGGGGGPWSGTGGQSYAPPPQAAYTQPGYGQQGYPQSPYGQGAPDPGYAQPAQRGGMLGGLFGGGRPTQPGGFGSFLRSAGTAAAGVAGGEFLFSGLSNMFGGGRGGFGGGFGGGGYGQPMENVTINEYGDGGGMGGDGGFDQGGVDDGGGYDDGGVG